MAKIQMTARLRSPDELLVKGTSEGNPRSSSGCNRSSIGVEVESTSTSSSPKEKQRSRSGKASSGSCGRGVSLSWGPRTLGHPGWAEHSLPQPKSCELLKEVSPRGKVPPAAGYRFVLPEAYATVNKPPAKCIAMYWAAFTYGVRSPLHRVIMDILNKYDLTSVQIVPTFWHNICSFIRTCELRRLTCTGRTFVQVHSVQRAPREAEDLGWYCFDNKKGFLTAIEKNSKKYNFLLVHREAGWGDHPNWNEGKPVRNPYRELTEAKKRAARYFHFYVQEDDRPRPIPKFMALVVEAQKGPERKHSRSSEREPMYWFPMLKYFANDFFLAAAGLLILKEFSKEQARAKLLPLESGDAKAEQAAAEAKKVREEVRCKHVQVLAKKVYPQSLCIYPSLQFFFSFYVLTDFPSLQALSLAPRSKKPIIGSLNLPRLVSHKRLRIERRYDVAATFAPTSLRAGAPSSKGKGIEGLAQSQSGRAIRHTLAPIADFLAADAPTKRTLVEKLAKSWSPALADSAKMSAVDEEHVAMAEIFARALKVAKSRPSVSALEKRIYDLEIGGNNGQVQVRSEKLKKEKEAVEAEKMDLERQLGEAHS
ncbi:hypothetical protein Cgig2_033733 [Carnegiea gigantea]|uniref:Uncharacterized protein n=1 Tax=Carnegiea gigantea TaxID=171969 RepID=A0A9Q1K104_9CARY|nr:hypothetical protein Cgig2_033733 [Carnegiea gigantea]